MGDGFRCLGCSWELAWNISQLGSSPHGPPTLGCKVVGCEPRAQSSATSPPSASQIGHERTNVDVTFYTVTATVMTGLITDSAPPLMQSVRR